MFNRVPPSALAPHALRCTQQLLGRHLPSPVAVPGRPTSAPDAVPKQDVALLKGTPLLGWGGEGGWGRELFIPAMEPLRPSSILINLNPAAEGGWTNYFRLCGWRSNNNNSDNEKYNKSNNKMPKKWMCNCPQKGSPNSKSVQKAFFCTVYRVLHFFAF